MHQYRSPLFVFTLIFILVSHREGAKRAQRLRTKCMGTKCMETKCEIKCGDEVSLSVFNALSPHASSDTLSPHSSSSPRGVHDRGMFNGKSHANPGRAVMLNKVLITSTEHRARAPATAGGARSPSAPPSGEYPPRSACSRRRSLIPQGAAGTPRPPYAFSWLFVPFCG